MRGTIVDAFSSFCLLTIQCILQVSECVCVNIWTQDLDIIVSVFFLYGNHRVAIHRVVNLWQGVESGRVFCLSVGLSFQADWLSIQVCLRHLRM